MAPTTTPSTSWHGLPDEHAEQLHIADDPNYITQRLALACPTLADLEDEHGRIPGIPGALRPEQLARDLLVGIEEA